jgi:hypothetical protein
MRQVIQVSGPVNNLVALCDDGTIWAYIAETTEWSQLPLVPGQTRPAGADSGADTGTDGGDVTASGSHDRKAMERQERAEQERRARFHSRL